MAQTLRKPSPPDFDHEVHEHSFRPAQGRVKGGRNTARPDSLWWAGRIPRPTVIPTVTGCKFYREEERKERNWGGVE